MLGEVSLISEQIKTTKRQHCVKIIAGVLCFLAFAIHFKIVRFDRW